MFGRRIYDLKVKCEKLDARNEALENENRRLRNLVEDKQREVDKLEVKIVAMQEGQKQREKAIEIASSQFGGFAPEELLVTTELIRRYLVDGLEEPERDISGALQHYYLQADAAGIEIVERETGRVIQPNHVVMDPRSREYAWVIAKYMDLRHS